MMTREQYRDWYYHQMLINNSGCGTPLMLCLVIVIVATMLCSCRSIQYVPVETVKTEYRTQHDTIIEKDTVNHELESILREANEGDSLMLAQMGIKLKENERLLILLQRELKEAKSERKEVKSDTVTVKEEVQVPYPVEKQLTRWQSFCIDYGKIMLGMTVAAIAVIVVLVILWRRKKR